MSEPGWVIEACEKCPIEAADLNRMTADLQALPKDAPVGCFVELYEAMLEARDRLYEAWISKEMDA